MGVKIEYSFPECPNRCTNGRYFSIRQRVWVECEYCKDKRKELLANSSFDETEEIIANLRLPKTYTGYKSFDVDSVINKEYREKNLQEESVVEVLTKIKEVFNDLSIGVLPKHSIYFYLGEIAYVSGLISAMLVRAYINGITTTPYLTDYNVFSISRDEGKTPKFDEEIVRLSDLVQPELCIVNIMAGSTAMSRDAVKRLLEMRSDEGRSTIIFSKAWNGGEKRNNMIDTSNTNQFGTLYTVKYRQPEGNKDNVENNSKKDSSQPNKSVMADLNMANKFR